MKAVFRKLSFVPAVAAVWLLAGGAALAGPAEEALLQSYVGGWKGTGVLMSRSGNNEDFTCRVTVSRGRASKINYAGRCSVAGLNLSVAGTIAYVDGAGRYEAAMSSNANFTGVAIGRQVGDRVVFDLREREQNAEGRGANITAQVSIGGDDIGLKFSYEPADSSDRSDASVTFARLPG
jgi:hypothetical protein